MKTSEIALLLGGRLEEAKKAAARLLPPDAKIMTFGDPRSTAWVLLARKYGNAWHVILVSREEKR